MGSRPADPPGAPPFFRAYAGSGLVLQVFARSQRTPSRTSVARIGSPVTRAAVKPRRWASSAARSSVHRLVGCPKARGLRCSRARSASAVAGVKAAWAVWTAQDRLVSAATPSWSKAWIALRTVCWSQLRLRAIRGTGSPRALAAMIWLRRRVKACEERRPTATASRSASASGRTKIGRFIPARIPHSRPPALMMH